MHHPPATASPGDGFRDIEEMGEQQTTEAMMPKCMAGLPNDHRIWISSYKLGNLHDSATASRPPWQRISEAESPLARASARMTANRIPQSRNQTATAISTAIPSDTVTGRFELIIAHLSAVQQHSEKT